MRTLILPLFILGLSQPVWAQTETPVDPTAQESLVEFGGPEPVILASGEQRFTVMAELATTQEQMQRGLMWREEVPAGTGMLFHYNPPQRASMWMENTLVDLDLVYIDEAGTIVKIIAYAQSESRRSLPANANVAGVLELAAGQAIELGLRPGDTVQHAIFGNVEAEAAPVAEEPAAEDASEDTP
ncbi:DUF192 domain-containing protein [Maricaulis parjimensis]|uniref:DUF192 domain-containing protein n=1 Tax=Maricaulis parjimensis TaxID=144023 RepID=UPI00193ABF7F|nr:DUF192 domain-containing protein [Maricaulis parjimensis]